MADPADSLLGRKLGPVTISRRIGGGGMGAVYLGRHEGLDKDLVVKVLPKDFASDPVRLERFRREARACAALDHENVVKVHGCGSSEDGVHYLLLEYVKGKNLEEILKERGGPLHLPEAMGYVRAIAAALAAAHQAGLVHRDVKPSNVLVSDEGAVKVADFGLVREPERSCATPDTAPRLSISRPGEILGTPHFLSPEQADGRKADARSDLYSLGVLFFNLVTGSRPFTAATPAQVLVRHMVETPPKPSDLVPGVPAAVDATILRLLDKDPEKRHQSAGELLAELERLPLAGHPSGPARRARAVVAVVVLAAVAGVASFVLLRERGQGTPLPEEGEDRPAGTLESPPVISARAKVDALRLRLSKFDSGEATRAGQVTAELLAFLEREIEKNPDPEEVRAILDELDRAIDRDGMLDAFPLAKLQSKRKIEELREQR
ncbi:MAG: protein kinase [Planctomycetes bacterium]|nr:protein kinase [Planctomycetota bacterium]